MSDDRPAHGRSGSRVLTGEEIAAAVAERGLRWAHDGHALVTVWRGRDFAGAVGFVAQVAVAAERLDHHPDIDIRFATVVVRVWSHDVDGVTERDLGLAAAVDAIVDGGSGRNEPPTMG